MTSTENTYISQNGIKMFRGKKYNWSMDSIYYNQDEPFMYTIALIKGYEIWNARLDQDKKILSFRKLTMGDTDSCLFLVESMEGAEDLIEWFTKGMECEVMPLYLKENETRSNNNK